MLAGTVALWQVEPYRSSRPPCRQITNKLRLRRAARGSGEHRRMTLRSLEACVRVSKSAASSGRVEAPASQL